MRKKPTLFWSQNKKQKTDLLKNALKALVREINLESLYPSNTFNALKIFKNFFLKN